jgi:hypothetical protein
MDYDFDQLFALRTYYEENNGYINDEIDIIKLIKTDLIDNGMTNTEANKLLQEFYESFGITLKAEELEDIRTIEEIGNRFINSLMHGFNVPNVNNHNNIPSNNQTMNYVIQRNLSDSKNKKCKNINCKKNKDLIAESKNEDLITKNEDLITESKNEDLITKNEDLIAESKNEDLIAESKNEDLIAESKNEDLISENEDSSSENEDSSSENEDDCSCINDDEDTYEEYNNYNTYNNYQTINFGFNSLINNQSFIQTPISHNNVFSDFSMDYLISELLVNNISTEDVVCTLDEKDKENLKKIKLDNDLDDKCNVCMDQMKKEEEVLILPCKHSFHTVCIEEWLTKYNYICPICKQEVGKPKYNI